LALHHRSKRHFIFGLADFVHKWRRVLLPSFSGLLQVAVIVFGLEYESKTLATSTKAVVSALADTWLKLKKRLPKTTH